MPSSTRERLPSPDSTRGRRRLHRTGGSLCPPCSCGGPSARAGQLILGRRLARGPLPCPCPAPPLTAWPVRRMPCGQAAARSGGDLHLPCSFGAVENVARRG